MTNWTSVVRNPTFWAIYYLTHIDVEDDQDQYEVVETLFGCELTALVADETLTITFPAGYEWQIEFSTAPGIYHTLTHPTFCEPLLLGYDDPHCMLPILRWVEIAPLARCADQSLDQPFDLYTLYLLFYPLASRTQADDMAQVRRQLIQAWQQLGLLPPEQVAALVKCIVWPSETMDDDFCFVPVEWRCDQALGWITNANHSYRNPDNRWTPADFDRWNTFLALVMRCAEESE